MNMGIPGLGDREIYMALWMVILSMTGAVSSYLFHKQFGSGLDTGTLRSMAIYAFGGIVAGLMLVAGTKAGANIGHWDIIPIGLSWGFGWQQVLGRLFGWNENRKNGTLVEKLVETSKPTKKKRGTAA